MVFHLGRWDRGLSTRAGVQLTASPCVNYPFFVFPDPTETPKPRRLCPPRAHLCSTSARALRTAAYLTLASVSALRMFSWAARFCSRYTLIWSYFFSCSSKSFCGEKWGWGGAEGVQGDPQNPGEGWRGAGGPHLHLGAVGGDEGGGDVVLLDHLPQLLLQGQALVPHLLHLDQDPFQVLQHLLVIWGGWGALRGGTRRPQNPKLLVGWEVRAGGQPAAFPGTPRLDVRASVGFILSPRQDLKVPGSQFGHFWGKKIPHSLPCTRLMPRERG